MADHLAMSDEDFLKQPLPETVEANSDPEQKQEENPAPTPELETPTPEPEKQDAPVETPDTNTGDEGTQTEEKKDEAAPTPEGEKPADPAPTGSEADKPKTEAEAPNYQELYSKIMAPLKANGKTIDIKSPEEAIQLMQMGANYTRKMQELAPHRKLLTMVQSNNLTEDKLSFLIDLDKKDPEAIKKLIKESGIDPLDLDMNIEPAYREGSHKVSNEEVAFRTQLEELNSTPTGIETVTLINSEWDDASKEMLWQHPEVMSIIHTQRESGIYGRISDEMNRQKALGKLPPTTPFLEAYKSIGDQLQSAGAFNDLGITPTEPTDKSAVAPTPAQQPVTTRAATPKPSVDNSDKASAASSSRAAPGKAKESVNFLAMSDEDFLKAGAFEGRV